MPASVKEVDAVARLHQKVIGWRRYLHAHPELSFKEHETAAPTPTSVVARLRGERPGAVVALRADIDALPITEANEHDFVSIVPGVMHACGHHGHTAILLGVAKLLSESSAPIAGEVRLLFQHAEEHSPGGARALVQAGAPRGCG